MATAYPGYDANTVDQLLAAFRKDPKLTQDARAYVFASDYWLKAEALSIDPMRAGAVINSLMMLDVGGGDPATTDDMQRGMYSQMGFDLSIHGPEPADLRREMATLPGGTLDVRAGGLPNKTYAAFAQIERRLSNGLRQQGVGAPVMSIQQEWEAWESHNSSVEYGSKPLKTAKRDPKGGWGVRLAHGEDLCNPWETAEKESKFDPSGHGRTDPNNYDTPFGKNRPYTAEKEYPLEKRYGRVDQAASDSLKVGVAEPILIPKKVKGCDLADGYLHNADGSLQTEMKDVKYIKRVPLKYSPGRSYPGFIGAPELKAALEIYTRARLAQLLRDRPEVKELANQYMKETATAQCVVDYERDQKDSLGNPAGPSGEKRDAICAQLRPRGRRRYTIEEMQAAVDTGLNYYTPEEVAAVAKNNKKIEASNKAVKVNNKLNDALAETDQFVPRGEDSHNAARYRSKINTAATREKDEEQPLKLLPLRVPKGKEAPAATAVVNDAFVEKVIAEAASQGKGLGGYSPQEIREALKRGERLPMYSTNDIAALRASNASAVIDTLDRDLPTLDFGKYAPTADKKLDAALNPHEISYNLGPVAIIPLEQNIKLTKNIMVDDPKLPDVGVHAGSGQSALVLYPANINEARVQAGLPRTTAGSRPKGFYPPK